MNLKLLDEILPCISALYPISSKEIDDFRETLPKHSPDDHKILGRGSDIMIANNIMISRIIKSPFQSLHNFDFEFYCRALELAFSKEFPGSQNERFFLTHGGQVTVARHPTVNHLLDLINERGLKPYAKA